MKVLIAALATAGLAGCAGYAPYGSAGYYGGGQYYDGSYYGNSLPYGVAPAPGYWWDGYAWRRRDGNRDHDRGRDRAERDGNYVPGPRYDSNPPGVPPQVVPPQGAVPDSGT